jgi:hypothetical protein
MLVAVTFSMSFGCLTLQDGLMDGKYNVEFKRHPESNYFLIINGAKIIKESKSGVKEEGTIEWRGDAHFVLSVDTTTNGNTVAKQIISGLGPACYELNKKEGNKIYFRLTRSANLSIYLDDGILTRINE